MYVVGADGCKAGWFAVCLKGGNNYEAGVFRKLSDLWQKYHKADLILIDIPIGLREEGTAERRCDVKARLVLGEPRRRGVFCVPCRPAVYKEDREEASNLNRRLTGRGVGSHSWGIVPKIREVDDFLTRNKDARLKIREVHPEVCFWALEGGLPMEHNKKGPEGFNERCKILKNHYRLTDNLVSYSLDNYRRNQVSRDDILDALAAAVTAVSSPQNLLTLPENPEKDAMGFPMEMVYRRFIPGRSF